MDSEVFTFDGEQKMTGSCFAKVRVFKEILSASLIFLFLHERVAESIKRPIKNDKFCSRFIPIICQYTSSRRYCCIHNGGVYTVVYEYSGIMEYI